MECVNTLIKHGADVSAKTVRSERVCESASHRRRDVWGFVWFIDGWLFGYRGLFTFAEWGKIYLSHFSPLLSHTHTLSHTFASHTHPHTHKRTPTHTHCENQVKVTSKYPNEFVRLQSFKADSLSLPLSDLWGISVGFIYPLQNSKCISNIGKRRWMREIAIVNQSQKKSRNERMRGRKRERGERAIEIVIHSHKNKDSELKSFIE